MKMLPKRSTALVWMLAGIGLATIGFADSAKDAAAGSFTMDWDAAVALAGKTDRPIFVKFTGSDWCSSCKLMEKSVFTQDAWSAYAKENLVLVAIDFPQNESLVPAKWRERNEKLSASFKVEGFPTYLLVDKSGSRELARLGAGKDKTAASFVAEVAAAQKATAAESTDVAATTAVTDAVEPGKWTTNLDAAKAFAAENNRNLLLNFTGSDWCYPCKIMRQNVFEKDAWVRYATDNLVLVTVDFPSDKSKQSKETQLANRQLQKSLNVRGYPTFVLLKPDGVSEIGRLGGGRDKTPESFIQELADLSKPKAAATTDTASADGPATRVASAESADADSHGVMTEGAELGAFTMDYDAAVALATEKNLPLLLDFTGSDWCGWCKIMVKNVFSKQEWSDWAAQNAVLVTIDFPRNKDLVPEAFRSRNQALQKKFGVRGYPTYVILDSKGERELGRLGAGRDKTPASFAAEMNDILRFLPAQIEAYAQKLGGEQGDAYRKAHADLQQAEADLADATKRIADAKLTIRDMHAVTVTATPVKAADEDAQETEQAEEKEAAHAPVMTAGHAFGRWTMDYDAALAAAKDSGRPMLINFTGSDWCGWCKLMDKSVFADAAWTAYAKEKLILVTIDFPRNETIVPEAFKARNQELQQQFGVQGFPTYVLVDSDQQEIGRLGAGQGKTATSFSKEVDNVLAMTEEGIAAYVQDLSAADATAYRAAIDALRAAEVDIANFRDSVQEQTPETTAAYLALVVTKQKADNNLREFRAKQTAKSLDDNADAYLAAHAALSTAQLTAIEFVKENPNPTEENQAKYQELAKKVQEAQAALNQLEP